MLTLFILPTLAARVKVPPPGRAGADIADMPADTRRARKASSFPPASVRRTRPREPAGRAMRRLRPAGAASARSEKFSSRRQNVGYALLCNYIAMYLLNFYTLAFILLFVCQTTQGGYHHVFGH
jgi:hypothetical protein